MFTVFTLRDSIALCIKVNRNLLVVFAVFLVDVSSLSRSSSGGDSAIVFLCVLVSLWFHPGEMKHEGTKTLRGFFAFLERDEDKKARSFFFLVLPWGNETRRLKDTKGVFPFPCEVKKARSSFFVSWCLCGFTLGKKMLS